MTWKSFKPSIEGLFLQKHKIRLAKTLGLGGSINGCIYFKIVEASVDIDIRPCEGER